MTTPVAQDLPKRKEKPLVETFKIVNLQNPRPNNLPYKVSIFYLPKESVLFRFRHEVMKKLEQRKLIIFRNYLIGILFISQYPLKFILI